MDFKNMDDLAKQISIAFNAGWTENVLAKDLPEDVEYIDFCDVLELKGITKVSYCSNLLSFILFSGNEKVYMIPQSYIHKEGNGVAFLKLMDMRDDNISRHSSNGRTAAP